MKVHLMNVLFSTVQAKETKDSWRIYLTPLHAVVDEVKRAFDPSQGTVLLDVDLSQVPYPRVGQNHVLYNSDDLMVLLVHPSDETRVSHPAFSKALIGLGFWNCHFTRYPHPSTGFDETQLQRNGIWFADGVHASYPKEWSEGKLSKIYLMLIPMLSEEEIKKRRCRFMVKIPPRVPQEVIDQGKQFLWSQRNGMFYEDRGQFDRYPTLVNGYPYFYPIDETIRQGDEFFLLCADYLEPDDETKFDIFADDEVKVNTCYLDRYFGKLVYPPSISREEVDALVDPSQPELLLRDPLGNLNGHSPLLASICEPQFLMWHFPFDVVIRLMRAGMRFMDMLEATLGPEIKDQLPTNVNVHEIVDLLCELDEDEMREKVMAASDAASREDDLDEWLR